MQFTSHMCWEIVCVDAEVSGVTVAEREAQRTAKTRGKSEGKLK